MFKHLTTFSYKRNWKEAIGFYIAFLILGLVLGGIAAVFGGASSGNATFNEGVKIGALVSIIYCLLISGLLLKEKRLFKNFVYILLALVSGLLAGLGGGLLGMIIPAFLTTRENGATLDQSL